MKGKDVAIAVGVGTNKVKVPCLWFRTFEVGLQVLTNILGQPTTCKEYYARWKVDYGNMRIRFAKEFEVPDDVTIQEENAIVKEYEEALNNGTLAEKVKHGGLAYYFFNDYYGGSGGCHFIELSLVEEGKPFVCWGFD